MKKRADAHIHLFSGGYKDRSFVSRPGISIDEAKCYDSLARDHDVAAALVVGYGGEDWCVDNNAYLAEQLPRYSWIRPVAYVSIDSVPAVEDLEVLRQQGFLGIALFLFGDEAKQVESVPDATWRWLEERRWLVSVNSEKDAWSFWSTVLEIFPTLRVLVSHLGLPPAQASAPNSKQAGEAMRSVTALAMYPGVTVKLSGFYALTTPGHDYPHQAAWPYVEQLVGAFSCDRLLWASDFSPCLDWITFPQTIHLFDTMPFLSPGDLEKITGGNLLALLDEVKR